jgi:hypothetical protein
MRELPALNEGPDFVRRPRELKDPKDLKMSSAIQTGRFKHRVLLPAVLALVCAPALFAWNQHPSKAARQAARSSAPQAPQNRPNQNANPYRTAPANQGRPSAYPQNGNGSVYPNAVRPAYRGQPYGAPAAPLGAQVRPFYNQNAAPPGHLGDWLNQHRGQPVQEQERMLRSDPNFTRLPAGDQQRLLQQLHRVNQMPEDERQRRLGRAEMLEHLSPRDRMQVNDSFRRMATLPADRRTALTSAFRDLRAVPPDQRPMVLNSSRYQNQFSPDERGMLTDMLRAEPYEPAR